MLIQLLVYYCGTINNIFYFSMFFFWKFGGPFLQFWKLPLETGVHVFTGRFDNMLLNLPVKCSHQWLRWNSSYIAVSFFIIIINNKYNNYDIKQQSWLLVILAVNNSDACTIRKVQSRRMLLGIKYSCFTLLLLWTFEFRLISCPI